MKECWAERQAQALEAVPERDAAVWHAIYSTIEEAARRVCQCGVRTNMKPTHADFCPARKVLAMGGK